MSVHSHILIVIILAIGLSLRYTDGDNVRLPDQQQQQPNLIQQQQQQQQILLQQQQQQHQQQQQQQFGNVEGRRQGKHLLDFVGLGTGKNTDPYVAQINANCLTGDLAECFKSQALSTFTDFFNKDTYFLSANARITRSPEYEYRSLEQEPYEFSSQPRSEDSEWDQLVKFALRKVEKFIKSATIELNIPNEITEGGRYSPRFISDEIADEIDVIEDKKAPLFSRNKLKKLIIPMLIILKLFKLKLLLFLPLILGLASFKKLLGFLAIIIPGVIGYFKFCKPQSNFGGGSYNNGFAQYSPQGLGSANYHQHQHIEHGQLYNQGGHSGFSKPYGNYYYRDNSNEQYGGGYSSDGNIKFGDDAQDLAYQGYSSQYRNKNVESI